MFWLLHAVFSPAKNSTVAAEEMCQGEWEIWLLCVFSQYIAHICFKWAKAPNLTADQAIGNTQMNQFSTQHVTMLNNSTSGQFVLPPQHLMFSF